MPVGGFLDLVPAPVFIAVHLVALGVAIWAVRAATNQRAPYAYAFALYALSQIGFLAFFGGAITLKMGVLLEQTLVLAIVLWIALRPRQTA